MHRTPTSIFLDVNFGNISTVQKSTDALLVTYKEIVLEVNADNSNGSFTFTSHLCCNIVEGHSHIRQPSEEVEIEDEGNKK
jgi:hypothetical protein